MDFSMSERQRYWRDRVIAFMNAHVYPAIPTYDAQMEGFGSNRWQVVPVLEELKAKAKAEGLWNLFLPPSAEHDDDEFHGAGLNHLEYAALCRADGPQLRLRLRKCSTARPPTPATWKCSTSLRHVTEQKEQLAEVRCWQWPRSAPRSLMTEPAVASSRRHQHRATIRRDGDQVRRQRPQVVVVRHRRSALQGHHLHGQVDSRTIPAATGSTRWCWCRSTRPASRCCAMLPVFGYDDAAARPWRGAVRERARTRRVDDAARASAAASRSPKAASGRAASITACAAIGARRTGAGADDQAGMVARRLRQAR
jgi:hypothetical protein